MQVYVTMFIVLNQNQQTFALDVLLTDRERII